MPVQLGLPIHDTAAIRMEHLTGHVGRIFRSEKHKTGGNFFRLACASQRRIGTKCRHFLGRERRGNQRRPNWSRRDRVYPDLLFRQRLGQGASESDDRDFRTLFGEKDRDGAADSAVSTCDQRDFVPKFPTALVITGTRAGLRPHFVLATRPFSLVLQRATFLFLRHSKKIFAAREYLSRACLRKGSATRKKSRKNPVDDGLTRINFLIPVMRGLL